MEREEEATARESEQERRRTRWRRGGARKNDEAHTVLDTIYLRHHDPQCTSRYLALSPVAPRRARVQSEIRMRRVGVLGG
jgi:hypothetical protein